ncbi:MAG TPA: hypothetical protein DCQ56_02070 [Porphyromonadaceae bacterium]|nr:hypothetical protein [Porphyromonadaceae bacterium]
MKKVLFLLIAALLLGVGNVSAQTKKAHKKAKAPVAAKAQPRCFTGTYENTGNGILTDYLALEVNEETNEVVGTFKDGTGVVTNLKGVRKGAVLVLQDAATGEEFDEARMYDNNTLKFSSFTGTFKRTSDKYIPIQGDAQPEVEKAGNTTLEEAAEKVRRAAAAGGPVF